MDIRIARVVVIEDDPFMTDLLLDQLRYMGILDTHCFEDGSNALEAMARLKPDLVISDIHMQPMSGLEFLRNLRADTHGAIGRTPVLFLSSDSTKGTVAEALPLGVSGYIVKPPSIAALKAKIELALKD